MFLHTILASRSTRLREGESRSGSSHFDGHVTELEGDALPPACLHQTPLDLALGLLQPVQLDVACHLAGVGSLGGVERTEEVDLSRGGVAAGGRRRVGRELLQGWTTSRTKNDGRSYMSAYAPSMELIY